jgi:hypothetical protein
MFHIVGTNHELQHTAKPFRALADMVNIARDDLKAYLERLAEEIQPAMIAEEYCQDLMELAPSNVKRVADNLRIAHRFCDPDVYERERLGLPLGIHNCDPEREQYFAIKECYWLDRLHDVVDQEVLFVCGAEHVPSFTRLLNERGIAVAVCVEYFGKELFKPTQCATLPE